MATAIIVLAAGNSGRMGKPKQLLTYKGRTLLDIVIEASLQTAFKPVVVVLGAYAEEIMENSVHPEVVYVLNEAWASGMSSSISIGLKTVLDHNPEIENAIITVADQVHISAEIFESLTKKWQQAHKNIVTCAYAQTSGTPALFNKKYFGELLKLSGKRGAKNLIQENIEDSATIPFELGKIDIDTETDYTNLINNK